MIRHIVWWTLKERANGRSIAENIEHIRAASAMLHGMPALLSIEVSAKVLPSSTEPAQIVLMSTHKTTEDLEQYRVNPVHLQFAKLIGEVASSRHCIDYGIDED